MSKLNEALITANSEDAVLLQSGAELGAGRISRLKLLWLEKFKSVTLRRKQFKLQEKEIYESIWHKKVLIHETCCQQFENH